MSIINFNNIHSEVKALILKDVIDEEGTLKCRLVCKDWKGVIDERVFKSIVIQLQEKIGTIPTAVGIRSIVIKFTDETNPKNKMAFKCDVQKVQQFCSDLATAIGPKAKKLITSAEEINALIQKDTNLHILWEEIQTKITTPSLKTYEEISCWMSKNMALLSGITMLSLVNKKLTTVPEEIKYLTSLRSLFLQKNQLKKVPEAIGNCTQLTFLFLNDNQLKELPKGIRFLANLGSLDLSNNQFKEVPREIGNCVNLKFLNLTNNQLKKVPKEIGNCKMLLALVLQGNPIEQNLSDEMAHDLSILERMGLELQELHVGPTKFIDLFKQLSENGKNDLTTYFYQHSQDKFTSANKNRFECAKETLYGNPLYTEFLDLDDLRMSLVQLKVKIASSNDVEEKVPISVDV